MHACASCCTPGGNTCLAALSLPPPLPPASAPPWWKVCRKGFSTESAAASRMAYGKQAPFLCPPAASSAAPCQPTNAPIQRTTSLITVSLDLRVNTYEDIGWG